MPTMATASAGLILIVMAVAAVVQAKKYTIALILFLVAFAAISWAIYNHSQLKKSRYRSLIYTGSFDKRRKTIELYFSN